jgi:hypothetical protein
MYVRYSWEHGRVRGKPKEKGKVSYLLGMAPKLSAEDFSPTILVLKYMRCGYLRTKYGVIKIQYVHVHDDRDVPMSTEIGRIRR